MCLLTAESTLYVAIVALSLLTTFLRVYFPNSILYPGRLNGVTQLKSRTADQPVRYGSLPEENNIKQTNHKNTRQNKTHNKHWRDQRKQQSLNIPRPGSGTRSQNTQNNTPILTTLFFNQFKEMLLYSKNK